MSGGFDVRLERVLKLRRLRERQAQAAWDQARRALEEEERTMRALEEEVRRAREQPVRDGAAFGLWAEFLSVLDRRIRRARERGETLGAAETRAREALREARQAVRVLERVRQRRLEEERLRQERREQKRLDEAAARTAAAGSAEEG